MLPDSVYEHPLPALVLDIDCIVIETGVSSKGSFTVKNTGGGLLSGHIISRLDALCFSPGSWTGNSQIITYSFEESKMGQLAQPVDAHAYICTNGGEIALPITIKHTAISIPTEEGPVIATIDDFYDYAQNHPVPARRLFTSSEFYMLLLSTGYPFMEVYESLHKDVNRERAMDNFFILSGLKGKTGLTLEKQRLDIVHRPMDKIYEHFLVHKTDGGYADAPVTIIGDAPWLTLSTGRLVSSDYDKYNCAAVSFCIDPLLIKAPFAREGILVGPEPTGDNILEITFRRAAPFYLRLNRVGFRYVDKGSIEVENNTGFDMTLDVYCRDRHVRFYSFSYVVGTALSIPFEIRPSAFASAQRLFRRLPYVSTYIDVRARSRGKIFQKRLHLSIGEW